MKPIKVGNPLDESMDLGALVSQRHMKSVDDYVQIGLAEGATSTGTPHERIELDFA